jgi:hypothetical protein
MSKNVKQNYKFIQNIEIIEMKLIIEKHTDGYCGYPLGFSNGAIVGQGKT